MILGRYLLTAAVLNLSFPDMPLMEVADHWKGKNHLWLVWVHTNLKF